MVHRLSCSTACGIFLDQGSHLCLLHWQVDSLCFVSVFCFDLLEDTLCPLFQGMIIPNNLCLFYPITNTSFASAPLICDARTTGQSSEMILYPKTKSQSFFCKVGRLTNWSRVSAQQCLKVPWRCEHAAMVKCPYNKRSRDFLPVSGCKSSRLPVPPLDYQKPSQLLPNSASQVDLTMESK